jgi:hypothetical protein
MASPIWLWIFPVVETIEYLQFLSYCGDFLYNNQALWQQENTGVETMDIGHIGAGLMLKKVDKRVNSGGLILASNLMDIVFILLVLLGIETIPKSHEGWQYLFSTLPYSHSLLASIGWSALTFVFVFVLWRKYGWQTAAIIAAAVFSHFVLDLIYFAPGAPRDLITIIEYLIVIVGIWVYLGTKRKWSVIWRMGLTLLLIILIVLINSLPLIILALLGQISETKSPDLPIIGFLGIIQPLIWSGLAFWMDRSKVLEKE